MAVPNMWRTKKQRYSLQGEICPSCTSALFPPRKVCPHCGATTETVGKQALQTVFDFSSLSTTQQGIVAVPSGDD